MQNHFDMMATKNVFPRLSMIFVKVSSTNRLYAFNLLDLACASSMYGPSHFEETYV